MYRGYANWHCLPKCVQCQEGPHDETIQRGRNVNRRIDTEKGANEEERMPGCDANVPNVQMKRCDDGTNRTAEWTETRTCGRIRAGSYRSARTNVLSG